MDIASLAILQPTILFAFSRKCQRLGSETWKLAHWCVGYSNELLAHIVATGSAFGHLVEPWHDAPTVERVGAWQPDGVGVVCGCQFLHTYTTLRRHRRRELAWCHCVGMMHLREHLVNGQAV
jgi:hypothetical protein